MTIASELSARSHRAAEYLGEVGWTQDILKDSDGKVCATGAVMYCQPQDGDEQIIIQVLRHRGRAESWNDSSERTPTEVSAELSRGITDAELLATFGPQWRDVVALVRRIARMTMAEIAQIAQTAWAAARDAARDAQAAWAAARAAAQDAAWGAVWDAQDAAWGLSVRDLIGERGFTQDHYDTLTRTWREVIGPLHAEDAHMGGSA